MNYIPNTDADRAAMLAVVGAESVSDLVPGRAGETALPDVGSAAGAV